LEEELRQAKSQIADLKNTTDFAVKLIEAKGKPELKKIEEK
jgi:hypothetical protein